MKQSPVAQFAERISASIVLIVALVIIQVSSGLAKTTMSADNAFDLVFVRLSLGALVLRVLIRPPIGTLTRIQWIDASILGLAFAEFNVTVYLALINLPPRLVQPLDFWDHWPLASPGRDGCSSPIGLPLDLLES